MLTRCVPAQMKVWQEEMQRNIEQRRQNGENVMMATWREMKVLTQKQADERRWVAALVVA